jgi:hypothetical protein
MSSLWTTGLAGPRETRGYELLCFLAVAAIVCAGAFLIPNPYDNEGGIDAFIYKAYSINFGALINRYGPFYFSYRSTHLAMLWLASKLFGVTLMHKGLIALYFLAISGSLWVILRPHLSAITRGAFCVVVCLSPWMLRTMSTTYLDGVVITLMFVMLALLFTLARSEFRSLWLAAGAGATLGLIANANAYMVSYGALLFAGIFAAALAPESWRRLVVAGLCAVAAFLAVQLLLWLAWCGTLNLGYGTPWKTMVAWTRIALVGGAWDTDMFSVAVARGHGGGLLANPQPDVVRMTGEGQVHVLYPLIALVACLIHRLWAAPQQAPSTYDVIDGDLRSEWNMALAAAVLVGLFAYVTSESMGNQMLRWPFYFSYLAVPTVLALGFTAGGLQRSEDRDLVTPALLAAAGFTVAIHLAFSSVPGLAMAASPGRWFAKTMALAALACGLVLILPVFRARIAILALAGLMAVGVPLFNTSGTNIYSSVYAFDSGRVSRDIIRGQKALIDFTEANAPAPGVHPAGRPVLFWHPNSQYTISLQASYLSDYQSLHRHHSGPALPVLNDTAIGQLKAGYRPEIVFICENAVQCEAAHKAFRDLGVGYDVTARGGYAGRTRSVVFEYIRMHTKPQ